MLANIPKLRAARAWSIDDLAAASGVSRPTIWRIEAGRCVPRPETKRKLAKALRIPVSQLA